MEVPSDWPKWSKKCGAKRHHSESLCGGYAVVGMPRCRLHGCGGIRNKRLGEVRYMCWIILGGPQNMPVELACNVALYVFSEAVLKQGKGTAAQQMKAAMWLTGLLDT